MRIERLRREVADGRVRVAADVVWEDAARPPDVVFFETPERFGADLEASPEAFALAALPAAAWRGERRLRIDGALCPRLASGLAEVGAIWRRWRVPCRTVVIEATNGAAAPPRRAEPRASLLLSGGVDSLALLRGNRLGYPRDHPDSARDAIVLYGANGFEFADGRPVAARLAAYEEMLRRLGPLAVQEDVTLLPVRFNARWLLPGYEAWTTLGFAPMIAAVSHAFARRHTTVWLASSGVIGELVAHASHPDLDPLFSSSAVEIRVGDPHVPRLEKVRRIADWEPARSIVQPCWQRSRRLADGRLNCGRCEKCLRTMLALLILGKLGECPAFEETDVEPSWLRRVKLPSELKLKLLLQLEGPLARIGRHDLVRALARRRRQYRRARTRAWFSGRFAGAGV